MVEGIFDDDETPKVLVCGKCNGDAWRVEVASNPESEGMVFWYSCAFCENRISYDRLRMALKESVGTTTSAAT